MSIKVKSSIREKSAVDNFVPDASANENFQSIPETDNTVPESKKAKSEEKTTTAKHADADFGAMGFDTVWDEVKNKSKKKLPVAVDNNTDLGSVDIGADEENFRSSELDSKITPVVQEKVAEAVHQTVAINNDRMKVSMTEVLDEYNSDRLKELKKDRKKRQRKKRFWGIVKFVVIFVIIAVLMTNAQIRTRFGIIFQDTKKLVVDIFNDDPTTSNNVADDFLDNLGSHLNEVNTYEVEEVEEN